MKSRILSGIVIFLMVFVVAIDASAIGGRGGGGRGGGGGGGRSIGGGGGGGMSRPAPRPSAPSMGGGARPGGGAHPGGGAPSISRPSVSPPVAGNRPSSPGAGGGGVQRPNPPSGGLGPSIGGTHPSTLPGGVGQGGNRPNIPGAGNTPGFGQGRPSTPDLGGNRPSTLPGGIGQGGNRPGTLPGGGNRPNVPGVGQRPSAGDVSDFLGMNRPSTLPGGVGNQPGIGNRPGIGNQPGIDNRPGIGGGGGISSRPGLGEIDSGFNNRPGWSNIGNDRITSIQNNWGNAIGGVRASQLPANRLGYWNGRGGPIRDNWWPGHIHDGWFDGNWWNNHHHHWGAWHYLNSHHNWGWNYWWTVPVWGAVASWWNWGTYPADVWSEPCYYDYGDGGNVTYQDDYVYIGEEQICTADEYAESAAALATVPPPADETQAQSSEWLPLGTFAVVGNEQEAEPSRVLQLAVSKEGIISGTLYNTLTDAAQSVQGQVDKETQRVAMRIADSDEIVIETGIYNLTQEQTPILVHFGTERTETWMLVRLENPEEDAAAAAPAQ